MSPIKTLSVYSNKVGRYPNFASMTGQQDGSRRFIGWTETEPGVWIPKTEPETIPNNAEYRRAVKQGDLLPADKATADACGVTFTASKKHS